MTILGGHVKGMRDWLAEVQFCMFTLCIVSFAITDFIRCVQLHQD